jgi:hypothetical protein
MMMKMKVRMIALLLFHSRVPLNPSQNLNVSPKKNGAKPSANQSHPSSDASRRNIRNAALQTVEEEAPTPTASSRCKFSTFAFISSL